MNCRIVALRRRPLLKFRCSVWNLKHPASTWSSLAVRDTFTDFFKSQGHDYVPSSSVIPRKGEGVYFTNAGMNQFKPLFLGETDSSNKLHGLRRAVNSQKCIRVGGKHNDLEDVGHDLTHHTFFEMLGSWSFGDYFKREACTMAHQLLHEQFGLPPDRLYFTYFGGDQKLGIPADEECRDLWASLGVPTNHILPFGVADNFWDMGATGPCGPCTEIHYDHIGSRYAGPEVNAGSADVVEIWNLVFMQYNRQTDQSLRPLPSLHVDTGMGLERMTAVLNHTPDNYQTDLFLPLFDVIGQRAGCPAYGGTDQTIDMAYRTLADHSRMFTVAVGDGLLPSTDNLGHKLRGIIHRCIHLSRDVFQVDPHVLLPQLISKVVESLVVAYPGLSQYEQKVIDVIRASIDHHDKTRNQTLKSFRKILTKFEPNGRLSGLDIEALRIGHYGAPMSVERIIELASEHSISLDLQDYQRLADKKPIVQSAPVTLTPDPADVLVNSLLAQGLPTSNDSFKYTCAPNSDGQLSGCGFPCHIIGQSSCGQTVDSLTKGDPGEIVLDKTCFYSEAGGQGADNGFLVSESGRFQVTDVQNRRGYVVHYGHVSEGSLHTGQSVQPHIIWARREGCMRNHTATHLVNAALSQILPSSQQQGSRVTWHKMTFDFLALSSFDGCQINQVESIVRETIKDNHSVEREVMPLDEALQLENVRLLQDEEYPDQVSVIRIQSEDGRTTVSTELCGGTHVMSTAQLLDFCISHVSAKSQSVKRLTCVTGDQAIQAHANGKSLSLMCQLLDLLVAGKDGIATPDTDPEQGMLLQCCSHFPEALRYLQARMTQMEQDLGMTDGLMSEEIEQLQWENADTQRAYHLVETVSSELDNLQGNLWATPQQAVGLMSKLVSTIKKFRQVGLLPKLVRDEAGMCLDRLEHRVSERANAVNSSILLELVEKGEHESPAESWVVVDYDLDLSPRQVVKILTRRPSSRSLVCVRQTNNDVTAVISLPLHLCQPFSQEELKDLLHRLSSLGKAKGKLAAQTPSVAVYTLTLQTKLGLKEMIGKIVNKR